MTAATLLVVAGGAALVLKVVETQLALRMLAGAWLAFVIRYAIQYDEFSHRFVADLPCYLLLSNPLHLTGVQSSSTTSETASRSSHANTIC